MSCGRLGWAGMQSPEAAGSMGDTSARIFCSKLEAELVAIAGLYKTSEDMQPELRGKSVQFWLKDDALLAEKLG